MWDMGAVDVSTVWTDPCSNSDAARACPRKPPPPVMMMTADLVMVVYVVFVLYGAVRK